MHLGYWNKWEDFMDKYTENILYEICDKLQLQASLYKLAEQRYKTVTDIIQSDDKF